ncbi:MAG: DUF4143 domain-containing protein [Propionibacteriaceae bacterium]|nr:DUF4143 domain-containing protein [Propionibacteriaceae bacterium]
MSYSRRVIDDALDELFPHLAAIAIEGAKGVGKTMTATQRAVARVNLANRAQRLVIQANPNYVVTLAKPTFIDEWQLVPDVWEEVKASVDGDHAGGQFLLAGSAGLDPAIRVHSGAGRIVSMTMRPMGLSERGLVQPTVSMRSLLGGEVRISGDSPMALPDYVDAIVSSGFPALRGLPPRALNTALDSYIQRVIHHDLEENGLSVRRPQALLAWLTAYAAATSTVASYNSILDAATPGDSEKPARQTVTSYREALTRLFMLDPVPAWLPALSPLKRLAQAPKHHLVDPALAARLTGATRESLLRGEGPARPGTDATLLGALFESLATQAVRVLAEALGVRLSHLRTRGGEHEIDLIIEAADRRVVAFEVKLSGAIDDRDVRHLHWLREQIGDRLIDSVVLSSGPIAYRRPDGVAVVPLALLGP